MVQSPCELAAEEQDASPVVGKRAEARCRVLQCLDDDVVALGRGVGDGVEEVGQDPPPHRLPSRCAYMNIKAKAVGSIQLGAF
jgi:hypothetical protein